MRIPSNQYKSVIQFALEELQEIYPVEEIKSLMYWLFEEYMGVDKTQFLLNPQKGMSESELLKFNFAIKDLKKGKPIQYILGYSYFHELKILVNKHTLIPRPETEELVQWVYEESIKNVFTKSNSTLSRADVLHPKIKNSLKILDMCTGTGCIPLALADKMPQHQYYGADFKQEILDLAEKNAKLLQKKMSLFQYDLLEDDIKKYQDFDIIISNPPYVLKSDKKQMHQNVLKFEPSSALYVDDDHALLFYEKILDFAQINLKKEGPIYFEIHENKSIEIKELFSKYCYKNIEIKKDFRGKTRFVKANKG